MSINNTTDLMDKINVSASAKNRWYFTPVDDVGIAVTAAILLPMLLFGVFANVLTMVVILRSPKLNSVFHLLIVSLCVSDLLSALLSALFLYRRTWGVDNWANELPEFFCKLSWGGDTATSVATSIHIVVFSSLRFFSLRWPHSYKLIKPYHAKLCIAIIWLIAIGTGFVPNAHWMIIRPVTLAAHLRHDKSKTWQICSLPRKWYSVFKDYTVIGYTFLYYVPLVLVCITSAGVTFIFCSRRAKKNKNANGNPQTTTNQQAIENERQKKENQAIFQLALIVGSFMLGYVPQSVYYIYVSLRGRPTSKNIIFGWWFSTITYMLLRFSECLNPVVYNLGSSQIREETMTYLRCCRKTEQTEAAFPKAIQETGISKTQSIRML